MKPCQTYGCQKVQEELPQWMMPQNKSHVGWRARETGKGKDSIFHDQVHYNGVMATHTIPKIDSAESEPSWSRQERQKCITTKP